MAEHRLHRFWCKSFRRTAGKDFTGLTISRICGGKFIPVAEAEKIGVGKILNDEVRGAGRSPL
jgi:hypothetical protein